MGIILTLLATDSPLRGLRLGLGPVAQHRVRNPVEYAILVSDAAMFTWFHLETASIPLARVFVVCLYRVLAGIAPRRLHAIRETMMLFFYWLLLSTHIARKSIRMGYYIHLWGLKCA